MRRPERRLAVALELVLAGKFGADGLVGVGPFGAAAGQALGAQKRYSAVPLDERVEERERRLTVHPMERAAHDDEVERGNVGIEVARGADAPIDGDTRTGAEHHRG